MSTVWVWPSCVVWRGVGQIWVVAARFSGRIPGTGELHYMRVRHAGDTPLERPRVVQTPRACLVGPLLGVNIVTATSKCNENWFRTAWVEAVAA